MSLYTEWRNLVIILKPRSKLFWEAYLQQKPIYNELLNNKQEVVEGKVSELAHYNVSVKILMDYRWNK